MKETYFKVPRVKEICKCGGIENEQRMQIHYINSTLIYRPNSLKKSITPLCDKYKIKLILNDKSYRPSSSIFLFCKEMFKCEKLPSNRFSLYMHFILI